MVKVEGQAVSQNLNFFVVTELKTMGLVMSSEWMCKSVYATDPQLVAHINYGASLDSSGAYQLRVEKIEDHATYSIAQIDRAFFKELVHGTSYKTSYDSVSYEEVFGGSTRTLDVMLDIFQEFGHFQNIPAVLKLARRAQSSGPTSEGYGSEVFSEIKMICSQ